MFAVWLSCAVFGALGYWWGWESGASLASRPVPSPFPPGTFVRLKSGGPVMTVCWEDTNDDLRCAWADGGRARFGHFPSAALVATPPGVT